MAPRSPRQSLTALTSLVRGTVSTTTGKLCALTTCAYTTVLCLVPLFGVHGVESAFALGLILPVVTALHVEAQVRAACTRTGLAQLRQAAFIPLLHLGLATSILALNSIRIRQCEPWLGLAYIVLGPGVGCLLAGQLTPLLCHAAVSIWKRRLLAIALPLTGLAYFAWCFYNSPAIFAYGHFFGYFPGSFYDELIRFPLPLLALRASTGCVIAAAIVFAAARTRPPTSAWTLGRPRTIAVLALLALMTAGLESAGPVLGFRVSANYVRSELGATYKSDRCVIHLPREYPHQDRFAADCDFAVREAERFLGLRQQAPVRVYLFRSADEKRRLIGAATTNVAKPWRNEVYVQLGSHPHPVLPHEIAHVVAGNAGSGPFRIAGTWGGLWPNPGLIEGLAVATDFRAQGGLTPHQWAKAALVEGIAPPIVDLFGAGFFNHRPGIAYTLAGSLIHFARKTKGYKPLLHAYQTGELGQDFEGGLPQLELEWHQFLESIELPASAYALAKQRFSGRGVLSAICPHRVAALRTHLYADLQAHNWDSALETCATLVDLDPNNLRAKITQIVTLANTNKLQEASQLLEILGPLTAQSGLQGEAKESLADGYFRQGQWNRAANIYQGLLASPQYDAQRRQRQVKRIAALSPPPARALLKAIFLPVHGVQMAPAATVHLARELRELRSDGLGPYLEARQLYFAEQPARAATLLDLAIRRGLPSAELSQEALRLSAQCHLEAGSLELASQRFRLLTHSPSAALASSATRFLRRIQFMRRSSHSENKTESGNDSTGGRDLY